MALAAATLLFDQFVSENVGNAEPASQHNVPVVPPTTCSFNGEVHSNTLLTKLTRQITSESENYVHSNNKQIMSNINLTVYVIILSKTNNNIF